MKIEDIRSALKNKTVGIAGCGGLGSNCAVALARTGIGKLVIVDFDRVDISNLNRQYFFREQVGEYKTTALTENIHKINDKVLIEPHIVTLDPASVVKIFSECDVIVEAFDTDHAKQMIIETVLTDMHDKFIISGQGVAGYGKTELITTRQIDKLFIVGDGQTVVSDTEPPLGPRVGIVANMQANIVLEILLNED